MTQHLIKYLEHGRYSEPGASLVAQMVKNLPAMQETWVRSLGREDPLEKEVATHSSILAWRTPWAEEPGGLQNMGLQRVGHDCMTNTCRYSEVFFGLKYKTCFPAREGFEDSIQIFPLREVYTLVS